MLLWRKTAIEQAESIYMCEVASGFKEATAFCRFHKYPIFFLGSACEVAVYAYGVAVQLLQEYLLLIFPDFEFS